MRFKISRLIYIISTKIQFIFIDFYFELKKKKAKADNIDALVDYKGRCEPCFLFYGVGMIFLLNKDYLVLDI